MSTTRSCGLNACRESFRKCWHFILCHRPHSLSGEDQFEVLCLGPSLAGKSTLLAQLVGESTANIAPTNGFNIKTLPVNGLVLSIKELGGSERVRTFWNNYYENKHALLFVVNASASDTEMQDSSELLRKVVLNFKDKPCMVIATHKDNPNARSVSQLEAIFQSILAGHKWSLYSVSAFDKLAIRDAIHSLATLINSVFV